MARRDRVLRVPKPTGKRRLIEWGKNLLIVLLTCSAFFLACQTPLVTHFNGFSAGNLPRVEEVSDTTGREALMPYALRVNNSLGAYGVSYDDGTVSRVFQRFDTVLSEAFSTVGEFREISTRQWRKLLESRGLYCVFQGSPALEVFSAWFGGEESLEGQLQGLLLALEDDTVTLAWRDGNTFYGAETALTDPASFAELLEDFAPNGASLAYLSVADDTAYEALDDYVLLTASVPQPQIYSATSPDFVADTNALSELLSALGFLAGADSAYETADGLTVTENGDRLQVTAGGGITYRAGDESRYPIQSVTRAVSTAAQAAQGAWELLCRMTDLFDHTPAYVLTGTEKTETGWEVTFEARLDGIPVAMGGAVPCVRVETVGNKISEFSLTLRIYEPTGETTLVPTPRLAAATLRSVPNNDGQLVLTYSDSLSATLTAGWLTGEQEWK